MKIKVPLVMLATCCVACSTATVTAQEACPEKAKLMKILVAFGNARNDLLGGGVNGVKGLSGLRGQPLAIDETLGLFDGRSSYRFRDGSHERTLLSEMRFLMLINDILAFSAASSIRHDYSQHRLPTCTRRLAQ